MYCIFKNTKSSGCCKKIRCNGHNDIFRKTRRISKQLKEKQGLLDAAIVFAPADIVTDTAIKSVKKEE